MCQVLNMSGLNIPGFSICQVLNFQCYTGFNYFLNLDRFLSEFASGCNCGTVLNNLVFWVFQVSAYASIRQGSEYSWIMLRYTVWSIMAEFWIFLVKIWQDFEYASGSKCQGTEYGKLVNMRELQRVLNMPELAWVCLKNTSIYVNMP